MPQARIHTIFIRVKTAKYNKTLYYSVKYDTMSSKRTRRAYAYRRARCQIRSNLMTFRHRAHDDNSLKHQAYRLHHP